MKSHLKYLVPVLVCLLFAAAGSLRLSAQITNPIRAHLDHSFVIGNTTLPPGDYTFRMIEDTDLSEMTVANQNKTISEDFIVRKTIADHMPAHSELSFRKYGNTEFLDKIFESGTKTGAEVAETSRQESRMVKHGQSTAMHTEVQK